MPAVWQEPYPVDDRGPTPTDRRQKRRSSIVLPGLPTSRVEDRNPNENDFHCRKSFHASSRMSMRGNVSLKWAPSNRTRLQEGCARHHGNDYHLQYRSEWLSCLQPSTGMEDRRWNPPPTVGQRGQHPAFPPTVTLTNGLSRMIGPPVLVERSVSEVGTGTVLRGVPLMDDVIQVVTVGTLPTGTIAVAMTPSARVVRRSDGRLLLAQLLHKYGEGSAIWSPVLREPVRSLRLQYVPFVGPSGLWIVLPGERIRRPQDPFQLVETITALGSATQRRDHAKAPT